MRLYHRTDCADAILREGFKDGTGGYLTNGTFSGVWLSDRPLDSNEGACGDQLLAMEIPEETVVEFEWVEQSKPYREFLIPSKSYFIDSVPKESHIET